MNEIRVSEMTAAFRRMLEEKWGYIPGSSGQKWTQAAQDEKAKTDPGVAKYGQQWVGHRVADCSGAFVYVYRQHGLSLYHGSNRIAREYVAALLPPDQARPGMAAFKAYKPGDRYYALPGEYKKGGKHYNGDLNDYYHIGLVDDDPQYVINAASTKSGVKRSKLADGWCAVGQLNEVDYGGGEQPVTDTGNRMRVTAANGKPVNLRQGPGVTYPRICEVPVGAEVTRVSGSGEWQYIQYGKRQGWMMGEYLEEAPEPLPSASLTPFAGMDAGSMVSMRAQLLAIRQAVDALEGMLDGLEPAAAGTGTSGEVG